MLVRVLFKDGTDTMVDSFQLDEFIRSGEVHKLRRANGWVTIGVDTLRGMMQNTYSGYERRRDALQLGGRYRSFNGLVFGE